MPRRSTSASDHPTARPLALAFCVLTVLACGDSRDILTVDICQDTLAEVMSVELIIRRPEGFDADPDDIREGAYVVPLEGPYQREYKLELVDHLGNETVMARAQLTNGCEFVTAEVRIDRKLNICVDGRDVEPTLSLGDTHTCAVFTNGSVRCWGNSEFDKLGTDLVDVEAMVAETMCPVPISPAIDVVAAQHHSCALMENGDVRCWGDNNFGKLGLGRGDDDVQTVVDPSTYPVVQLADKAIDLIAGQEHTCAVLTGGERLQCWGQNNEGQLGTSNRDDVGDTESPDVYMPLEFDAAILDVSLGDDYSCVRLDIDGGEIRCWGSNDVGQLGDPAADRLLAPPDAGIDIGASAIALAGSHVHNCAIRAPDDPMADPDAGDVVCWGENIGESGTDGYLGYGDTVRYGRDVIPNVALDLPGPVTQLAVGYGFTCARFAENDDVRCWGRGLRGRLGLPGFPDDIQDTALFDMHPAIQVAAPGETIERVFTGRNHACVIVSTGTNRRARCWGEGQEGQLGNGGTANIGGSQTPLQAAVEFAL